MTSVASKVRLPPQPTAANLRPCQQFRQSSIAARQSSTLAFFRNIHRNALPLTQFLRAEPLRASGYRKFATWSPDEPSNHDSIQATTRSSTPTESLSLLPRSWTSPSSAPASATLVPRPPLPPTLPDPLAVVAVTLPSLALSRVKHDRQTLAYNLTH